MDATGDSLPSGSRNIKPRSTPLPQPELPLWEWLTPDDDVWIHLERRYLIRRLAALDACTASGAA